MAILRHPVDSFDKKLNFWEEFSDYKIHPFFGRVWKINREKKLKESSLFMWALTLCYDRKSSFFNQPEVDKWEVVSEDLFGDMNAIMNFYLHDTSEGDETPFARDEVSPIIGIPMGTTLREVITEFEKSIDTPLGLSLRDLERKLAERTTFIMSTPYTIDAVTVDEATKKRTITKGTAEQLDKMFANTEKINALITTAMENLRSVEAKGVAKGGQKESLGDGDTDF